MVFGMNECRKKVAIIGGGASGALCAILIKKYCNCDVTIFELQPRILKKLLQTGNGMCNLTNDLIDSSKYNTDKIQNLLKEFNTIECKKVFNDLGLLIKKDNEGRYYPYSRKATTVCDILIRTIEKEKINIICDTNINKIRCDNGFTLYSSKENYYADYVIVSCGGNSSILYKNSGYEMLEKIGHHITPLQPSLVGFKVKENMKSLAGIRIKAKVDLHVGNEIKSGSGEIQLKDDGISGIVIMELSRFYDKNKKCFLSIDLMSDYDYNEIKNIISGFYKKSISIEDALNGIFPKMIVKDIINRCKDNNIDNIINIIKNYTFNIISMYGFENSQVTKGGVDLEDIDLNTFESLVVKNLYLIGEVLDVDGTCGGYNLHFAWASAYKSSADVVKKIKEKRI